MNLSLFIAKRYFFSKRKQNFINIISILSMVGVAFSTAALIIVLSVFNGLEGLLRSLYVSFDPELKIEAVEGKSFEINDELLSKLNAIEGVNVVTEVIEDYAYIRYRDADVVATIKGVSDNFIDQHRLDDRIVQGEMKLKENGIDYAILGRGIQYALSVAVEDEMYALQVFYIKDLKRTSLDPSQMYSRKSIRPGGVFSIEKNYDENYIFLPLDFVADLLDYGNKRTALEIKTDEGVNLNSVKQKVSEAMGDSFAVLTNEEQQKDLYRLLKIEKLFTFLALSLLITVGSINIFFSLMMLAIDKKKDISILSALGADKKLISRVFFSEGAIISFIGAGSGLIIGGLVCWAQGQFGLVGMGMENAVVSDYPVIMIWSDFALTSLVIIAITFLVSFYPAILASRSYSTQNL
ncbi:MAG: ABC transporter permease [Cyclobacteriaceae bacterium]|nr:ABC transporter permease [Cyclobacteriaceae bacterium]